MGCDNWRHAEMRARTDEAVSTAVDAMQAAGDIISPWRVSRRCGVSAASVATSLERLGVDWQPSSSEAAGETGLAPPPTPEQIRDESAAIRAERYRSEVFGDLAESLAELVAARRSGDPPAVVQRCGRLLRARRRALLEIGVG